MDIQQAKEQVRKTCLAYLTKDEFGDYLVPVETQRPIFLVGAPGIGKTAIMAQVADELGLGLVDYSMTHHTRQSAIGLPFIERREYGGVSYPISEYTMSEIIASVYETIERTGRTEGILFLDEVNCVSETLAPAMLRFLQSKTFGNHSVPQGWVVVSAGNPGEYNKSARAFDIATLDRVKRIDVEPDYKAWRAYAVDAGVHPAVLGYLDLKPDDFYRVETKGRVRHFVTARAWMDLSNICRLYELRGLEIDADLVGQYVQVPSIAADFVTYLELFAAYSRDYRIADILDGEAPDDVRDRAKRAGFDERMALCGLLADACVARAAEATCREAELSRVRGAIVAVRESNAADAVHVAEGLGAQADALQEQLQADALHFRNNPAARRAQHGAIARLRTLASRCSGAGAQDPYKMLAESFNSELVRQKERGEQASAQVGNALDFVAEAYGQGNELIALMSELTLNGSISKLVGLYGCKSFFECSRALQLEQRENELSARLDQLGEHMAAL